MITLELFLFFRYQITVPKPEIKRIGGAGVASGIGAFLFWFFIFSINDFTDFKINGFGENRTVKSEGVKFAVLAANVHVFG